VTSRERPFFLFVIVPFVLFRYRAAGDCRAYLRSSIVAVEDVLVEDVVDKI
jgi:hypothetical protein